MNIQDRLRQVREELREKRSQRPALVQERDAAKNAFAQAQHDGPVTSWPEFQAAEEAVRNLGTLDDQIADLSVAESGILQMLGEELPPDNPAVPGVAQGMHQPSTGWDARRLLAEGSSYEDAINRGLFTSGAQFGTVQLGEIANRDEAVSLLSPYAELPGAPAGPVTTPGVSPGSYGGLIAPDRRGMIAPLLRPLRLLDLFPTGATDSNILEYVQVSAIPSTVDVVAEGALKPEVGLTLTDQTAPVRTLAGWIKVNRQAMADAAGLATLINTLLPYDVRRKIEYQILNGDGTGQNLKGILHQTGLGSPAAVAGDNTADKVLRAITVIILSEGEPNFVAMHPIDWQNLLLLRENPGGPNTGQYLYGGPGSMAAATLWGMAITPTTALAQGAPLVGDSNGATILFREGVNVKTSDSDQDDFVRNRVTVLAEARIAFPVWRPTHFAVPQ